MDSIKLCTQMEKIASHDVSNDVSLLISRKEYLWEPGTIIKVSFLDGDRSVQEKVKQLAKVWENYANIQFDFGDYKEEAHIRISFKLKGSWSYLGKSCLSVEKNLPTMNYGWLNQNTTDEEYSRVVLHEFGHALGFGHEHQSPDGDIPWDTEKVYEYYSELQGWDRASVDQNVFKKYDQLNTNFSVFDPHSIMLYSIPEELTIGDFKTEWNTSLSDTDKEYASRWYPGGFRERIAAAFGYVKNTRLIATENRTEPQEGHKHWGVIHEIRIVQKEILQDTQRTLDTLDGLNKEQLDEIFGYMKNGRLMITTGNIEPQAGHVNWARGQTAEVVKQEIKRDANEIREHEKFRGI